MDDKYIIEFTKGGAGPLETMLTAGLPLVVDAITGNEDHGWYCTITDKETGVRESKWGATQGTAEQICFPALKQKVAEFKAEEKSRREEEEFLRQEALRRETERERELLKQLQTDSRQDNHNSSGDGNNGLIKIVGIVALVLVVLWLLFAIVLPLVVINGAALTLIWGLIKKKRSKFLFPISFFAALYLVIDYNLGFITWFLSNNFHFFTNVIPWLYCLNVIAGLAAFYFILRNFLNSKHQKYNTDKEFTRRNVIIMGSLLLVGCTLFGLQFFLTLEPTIIKDPPFREPLSTESLVEGRWTNKNESRTDYINVTLEIWGKGGDSANWYRCSWKQQTDHGAEGQEYYWTAYYSEKNNELVGPADVWEDDLTMIIEPQGGGSTLALYVLSDKPSANFVFYRE